MEIKSISLPGVYEITPHPLVDKRGIFTRVYDQIIFEKFGLNEDWVQENNSVSLKKNTIRGLHFQFPPFTEAKLVRVLKGEILDVFVDLRKESVTFGQWGSARLTAINNKMIYIPKGFAHGFGTLTDNCEVIYKVNQFYAPAYEGGIRWNDPTIQIDWPISHPVLSDKDAKLPTFNQFVKSYEGLII